MRFKSIMAAALAALVLSSCSKNDGPDGPHENDIDVAYLSINIQSQSKTRAPGSTEDPGANESDIKSLYIVAFNDANKVLKVPESIDYHVAITGANAKEKPEPIKISADVKKILVVANPGDELKKVITGLNSLSTFTTLNAAIVVISESEITDNASSGFAMINSGEESNAVAGVIEIPLIDVGTKIKKLEEHSSIQDAIDAAKLDLLDINIERLASKIDLELKNPGLTVKPAGATFSILGWTLDAVNRTFYPYAEKTLIDAVHSGSQYTKNFYTKDPNFDGNTNIVYTSINTDYSPKLIHGTTWLADKATTYCIENTMKADEQKYQNATRIVMKGQYYPDAGWADDWFSFAGDNYEDFEDLKTAYQGAGSGSNLETACNNFYTKVFDYLTAKGGVDLTAVNGFEDLDQALLDEVANGGEVVKGAKTDQVIRWYQDGLCHYYYEIRHDFDTEEQMAFAKYGVVRNNWYSLTVGTINGAGTPWYPDINNPGPGDPDPGENIDEAAGYLGIEIKVMPWILWKKEIQM